MKIYGTKLFLLLLGSVTTIAALQNLQAQNTPARFLAGIDKPEDLIRLPDSHWVIVSSYSTSTETSGKLMAIDLTNDSAPPRVIYPAQIINNAEPTLFKPHGINCLKTGDNSYQLFAINHGLKESVEVFEIKVQSGKLGIVWNKRIMLPVNVWANGIVASVDGAIYVTSMYDPADKKFINKFARGMPTGQVWRWTSNKGWQTINNKLLSAANGIEIAKDGQTLYVSEWAKGRLWRFSLDGSAKEAFIQLDFLTDNLRWTEAGKLLVTGQKASPLVLFAAQTLQDKKDGNQFSVVEIDPLTFKATTLVNGGNAEFGWGTVAIAVQDEIWVGSVLVNKIACYKNIKKAVGLPK